MTQDNNIVTVAQKIKQQHNAAVAAVAAVADGLATLTAGSLVAQVNRVKAEAQRIRQEMDQAAGLVAAELHELLGDLAAFAADLEMTSVVEGEPAVADADQDDGPAVLLFVPGEECAVESDCEPVNDWQPVSVGDVVPVPVPVPAAIDPDGTEESEPQPVLPVLPLPTEDDPPGGDDDAAQLTEEERERIRRFDVPGAEEVVAATKAEGTSGKKAKGRRQRKQG